MQKLFATLACSLALVNSASAADLTIHINDAKTNDGHVMVALYSSSATFLKKPAQASRAAALTNGNTVTFKDLAEGEYAFAVYHDANANGTMDKNFVGIPTEDYAFSNNAMGKMGPPSFDDAKIALPAAGAATSVTLR